jgi:hypothetical protein
VLDGMIGGRDRLHERRLTADKRQHVWIHVGHNCFIDEAGELLRAVTPSHRRASSRTELAATGALDSTRPNPESSQACSHSSLVCLSGGSQP